MNEKILNKIASSNVDVCLQLLVYDQLQSLKQREI
jgi:hypothetical protein